MFAHLASSFGSLFATQRSRVSVAFLVLVMAVVPLVEMAVLHLFSALIIDGPTILEASPANATLLALAFLLVLGAARAAHHVSRLWRLRVFRRGLEDREAIPSPQQLGWDWAMAFELSGVLVCLVQAATFSLFFLVLDVPTALVNMGASVLAITVISALYRRQLRVQEQLRKPQPGGGSTFVTQRLTLRVRDAEYGGVLATLSMCAVLAVLLLRTLRGTVSAPDAIILFLATRLVAGQISNLSGSAMRFARATTMRGTR